MIEDDKEFEEQAAWLAIEESQYMLFIPDSHQLKTSSIKPDLTK